MAFFTSAKLIHFELFESSGFPFKSSAKTFARNPRVCSSDNRSKLALLNEITHPEVMRRIADRLEELKETEHIVIVDVPLLAEVGASDMFDTIVVVTASEEAQVGRMRKKRGMGENEARARIAAQFPADFPGDPADRLIAATARAHRIPLVTSDERIQASPLVETVW